MKMQSIGKSAVIGAVFWLALSLLIIERGTNADATSQAVRLFVLFWLAALLDLFFLGKTIAVAFNLMSHQLAEKKMIEWVWLFFFGTGKLLCLGGLIVLIYKAKAAPVLAMVLGLATLVVIPLGGGAFWAWRNGSDALDKNPL